MVLVAPLPSVVKVRIAFAIRRRAGIWPDPWPKMPSNLSKPCAAEVAELVSTWMSVLDPCGVFGAAGRELHRVE